MIFHYRLIRGLEHEFDFPKRYGNFIIQTDEFIFFRGVDQPPTRYIYIYTIYPYTGHSIIPHIYIHKVLYIYIYIYIYISTVASQVLATHGACPHETFHQQCDAMQFLGGDHGGLLVFHMEFLVKHG